MPSRITIQSPDEIVAHFTLSEESIATSPVWGANQGSGDLVFRESAPAGVRKRVTMEFQGLDLEQIDQLVGVSSDPDSFVPDSASRFVFNENPLGSSDTVIQSGGKGFAGTAQTVAASTGSIVVNEGVQYRDFSLGEHIRQAVAADIASETQSREAQLMYDDAPGNMNTTPPGSLTTTRNPEFFLNGVYDFSGVCFSRWLSNGAWPQPGWYNTGLCCAINDRWAIVADHAKGVGADDYLFMRPDGTIDVMTPQSRHTISTLSDGGDIALIYFASEFHSSIKKYKCMPANWVRDFAPSLLNTDFRGVVPTYRQAKHDADGVGGVPFIVINELSYKLVNGALQNKRTYEASSGTVGYEWGTQQGIGGDSGHPSFLSINGDLVLFATAKSVTNDGDISDYITQIQDTMVSVGAADGDPNDYSMLDTVDLTGFINFEANLFDNGCAADSDNPTATDTNWKGYIATRNTPSDGNFSDYCIEVVMDPGDPAATRAMLKLAALSGFDAPQDGQAFRIFCDVKHAGGAGIGQVHIASNHYLDDLVELAEVTIADTEWRTVTGTFVYNHDQSLGSTGSHLVIHEKGTGNSGVTVRIGNVRIQPIATEDFYLDTGYYQEAKRLDLRIIGPSQFESVASPYTMAEPNKDFSMEILAIGGVYPYKFEIDSDLQGSGLSVQSVMADDGNGILDPFHANNENYGLLTGVLSAGSYTVVVRVTDQLGDSVTQQFTIDCNDSHVVHVKPSGSDANPGTETSPYQTLAYAMENNSDKIIRLYDDGAGGNATYDVEDVAGAGRLQISDTAGRNFIMGDPGRTGTITLHCPAYGGFQIATGQSDVDEFCVKDVDIITSDADGSVDFTTFMAIRSNADRVRLLRMGSSISFNQNDNSSGSNCGFWYEANPGQECAFSGGTFTGPSCAIAHRFDAEYSLVEKIRCNFTSTGVTTGTTGGVFNFKQAPFNAETRCIEVVTNVTDATLRPLKMKGQSNGAGRNFEDVHVRYAKIAAPNLGTSQMFNGEIVTNGDTSDNFWCERSNFQSDWNDGVSSNPSNSTKPTNSGVDHCVFNEVPEIESTMPVTNKVDPDTYSTNPLDNNGDLVVAANASEGLAGYAIKAVYSNNGVTR